MGINALTARRLADKRAKLLETKTMKKTITLPLYYEVYSGILNYRTGNWIKMDPVDIVTTKTSALIEVKWRRQHPYTPDMNALYIVRRYRHEDTIKITKNNRKAVESIC